MLRPIPKICCVTGAVILLAAGGCARQVDRREELSGYGRAEPAQGSSWELVLGTSPADLSSPASPEFGRADARLNSSAPAAQLATSQWPSPDRDSLDNARYLYLRDRDGRFTYFGPDRRFQPRNEDWGWR